ncbi:hypothetical protein BGX29_002544 [Mortierella sp. GBA35]|nr:hypothetical protein BGX29_002544 [Mortierella sp. GBA35]
MAPKAAWKAAIDGSKPGANFFLTRIPAEYNPLSYFKHRGATSSLREQLSHELSEWVKYFSALDKQIHHDIANFLRSYIVGTAKNDLRRQNVTQLRIDGDAMTEELDKALSELRHTFHLKKLSTKKTSLIRDLRRSSAEKGERAMGGPNTKKSATHVSNPFQSEASHEDDDDDEEEEDAATLVQEQGHHSLNVVFDYEAFAFTCVIGYYDISAPFNDYYEEANAVPYDHNTFQDFLATAGILFLGKEPTNMQRQHFSEHFKKLREVMVEMIQPNKDDEQAMTDEGDGAVDFCQAARNVFRKAERKSGSEYARKQLKKRIEEEEDSPLKELYEHAVKLPKECAPVSEANQTSSTATTSTSGSIFVRLYKNLITSSNNPDFLVRFKECLDIGVAEVSFEASARKDTGDLCRTALWSKRVLDEIVTKFENIEHVKLIFFQVVEQTCIFYTMKRADTVCIAYTVSDVLTGFEDDARDWLLVCRTFDSLVTTLKSAKERMRKEKNCAGTAVWQTV